MNEMRYEHVSDAVASSLGDFGEDYDVPKLVRAVVRRYGVVSIDTIPTDEYWDLVAEFSVTE